MRELLGAAVFVWLVGAGAGHAQTLGFDPTDASAGPGVLPVLEVRAEGVAPSEVGAFDFEIRFDPGVLAIAEVTLASALGDPARSDELLAVTRLDPGALRVAATSLLGPLELDALQGDPVPLVSVRFSALQAGQSAVTLADEVLGDENGVPFDPLSLGSATITAVPEPSQGLLLAAGAFVLAGARRLRRSR